MQSRDPGGCSLQRTLNAARLHRPANSPLLPCCPVADQPEFLSAVKEVAASLQPVFERQPELLRAFEIMCEPERQASEGWGGGTPSVCLKTVGRASTCSEHPTCKTVGSSAGLTHSVDGTGCLPASHAADHLPCALVRLALNTDVGRFSLTGLPARLLAWCPVCAQCSVHNTCTALPNGHGHTP